MIILRKIIYLLLLILLSATYSFAEELPEETRKALREKAEEVIRNTPPAHAYGKVIDLDGNPVEGAQVLVSWTLLRNLMFGTEPPEKRWIETDANGLWEFHGEKVWSAGIRDVKKEGYVFKGVDNNIRYPTKVHRGLIHDTSKNNPIVLVIRKKGEGTLLLKERRRRIIRTEVNEGQKLIWFDVIQDKVSSTPPENLPKKKKFYADLQIMVSPPDDVSGEWNISYKTTGPDSGIITSDEQLYVAPANGYQQEIVLNGPPFFKYLYLKTRNPLIYARLEVEHNLSKELFRLYVKSRTNPYGSRNLEYLDELDQAWRLRKKLQKEAKETIIKGERPVKGNLSQLIEDALKQK